MSSVDSGLSRSGSTNKRIHPGASWENQVKLSSHNGVTAIESGLFKGLGICSKPPWLSPDESLLLIQRLN